MGEGKVLSLRSVIVRRALNALCSAIGEHRWEDALTLLPSVVSLAGKNVSIHFIWKALQVVMLNCKISQEVQIKLLLTLFRSPIKEYEIAIDWLAEALPHIDHSDLNYVYQIVQEAMVLKNSLNPLGILFECYYAIYHYVEWQRKLISLNANLESEETSEKMINFQRDHTKQEEERKQIQKCRKQGIKAYDLLSSALSRLKCKNNKEFMNTNNLEHKQKETMCEWLLGPIIDTIEKLKLENDSMDLSKSMYFEQGLDSLALMEEYVHEHKNHLPALRFFYHYLCQYHPQEKGLISSTLQNICKLCPEDPLVVVFVKFLLKEGKSALDKEDCYDSSMEEISTYCSEKEFNQILKSRKKKVKILLAKESISKPVGDVSLACDTCLLKDESVAVLIKCVDLLTYFVEFVQNRKHPKAWAFLTKVLKRLHLGWISCWECYKCIISRDKIRDIAIKLSLWPQLFWDCPFASNLDIDSAKILVDATYAAFVFGYFNSPKVIENVTHALRHDHYTKNKNKLFSLINAKDKFSPTFSIYLSSKRNQCQDTGLQSFEWKTKFDCPVIGLQVIDEHPKGILASDDALIENGIPGNFGKASLSSSEASCRRSLNAESSKNTGFGRSLNAESSKNTGFGRRSLNAESSKNASVRTHANSDLNITANNRGKKTEIDIDNNNQGIKKKRRYL